MIMWAILRLRLFTSVSFFANTTLYQQVGDGNISLAHCLVDIVTHCNSYIAVILRQGMCKLI